MSSAATVDAATMRELLYALRKATEARRERISEPWLGDPPLTHNGLKQILAEALDLIEEEA